MKRIICCAMYALLASRTNAGEIAPLTIYTHFDTPPLGVVFDSMRSEIGALMAPLKIPIEWRALAGHDSGEASAEVAVVNFHGLCMAGVSLPDKPRPGPLAWTHVADGVVLPFAEVDCAHVRALAAKELLAVRLDRREAVFGRAVGRVVCHELYHILAGTRHHGNDDVAHPVYTANDLVADHFQFGNSELGLLRRSLAPALRSMRAAQGEPLQSAAVGRALYEGSACARCHGPRGEGSSVAPALRISGQPLEFRTFAPRLAKEIGRMYRLANDRKLARPPLNDDDIGDLIRYLNSLE